MTAQTGLAEQRDVSSSALTAVPVRALVLRERGVAGREEVVDLVGLADEVEVVDLRRMRGGADRRQPGVGDRRRRQAGELARVVRVVALQLRLEDRLRRRDVQPVAKRRVDPERHPRVQPVVDDRRDEPAAPTARASPSRPSRRSSARRTASGSCSSRTTGRRSASSRRTSRAGRRRGRCDVVFARKSYVAGKRKPSRFVRRRGAKQGTTAVRDARRYGRAASATGLWRLALGDLRDGADAIGHLGAGEALGEDDAKRLRRRRAEAAAQPSS